MNTTEAVPTREKTSYAMISFGISSISGVISAFVLYYFTDVALLAPAGVTWLLFAARFFDGAIDPFIGHYMDSRQTKLGKYKGYLVYWALPFCLLSILMFQPSPFGSGTGGLLWYLLVYLLWSFSFSMVESAQLPLLVVMTNDKSERYKTNSAKILGGILATLVARYVALELVELFGGGDEVRGYALTAALLAIVSFVFIRFPARRIVERNVPAEKPPNILKTAKSLLKDKRILFLLLFQFTHQLASSVKGQASIYYMKYIMDRQELTSWFLIMSTLASLAMQPVIILAAKKISLRTLIVCGYLGGAAGVALMGTAGPSVVQLFAGNLLCGAAVAFPANLLFVYLAQLADDHRGTSSATLHSLLGLSARFAVAISGSLIAFVLMLTDYIPNIVQSADSQAGISFVFITLTLVLYIGTAGFAFISFRYNTAKKKGVVA